jgi:glycosyltransferase involved in cell wall biosynthesis
MRVLHVPYCFRPDPIGGTEVYVEALSQCQLSCALTPVIAAPAAQVASYFVSGVKVHRFPTSPGPLRLSELYGDGDPTAGDGFSRILDEEAPDIVHLHAVTSAVSLRLVHEAKRRHLPVIFTYHTPTVSCQRGALLRWGEDVCDGVLDRRACTACTLHGLGLGRQLAKAVASIPAPLAGFVGAMNLSGRVYTAVRMPELIEVRHKAFRMLMREVDLVVAPCDWVRNLLVGNGVPLSKISLSRQGVATRPSDVKAFETKRNQGASAGTTIRIAFLGRLDRSKGAHFLVEALRQAPTLPIQLDLYGIAQGADATAYLVRLKALADGDQRIAFHDPIPSDQIQETLKDYDALAVPSQCLETGPLVVLEAFAAGVPVVGSKFGGIAELVTNGIDGVLVEPPSALSWRDIFGTVCQDRTLLPRLRSGIRKPRSVADVATDMSAIYERVLNHNRSAAAIP